MKKLVSFLLLVFGLFLAGNASAAPKGIKKHALAKELLAPVTAATKVPHAAKKVAIVAGQVTGKSLAATIGSGLFVVESGVDVVHLAADVVSKGTQAEGWKKANVFAKFDDGVGYVDSGLEFVYSYLFHVAI